MEYTLWISLLLVVFIFPLKSESIEDLNREDNVDDSENDNKTKSSEDTNETESPDDSDNEDNVDKPENESTTKSPEENNRDDNKDESGNGSSTNTTKSIIAVSKTDHSTTTTIQTRPDGMEMAQSGQDGFKDGQKETNIAVKVGVPVALVGLVIVIGIIRLVSSGQFKNHVLRLEGIFGKTPDKSISLYTTNGLSPGKGTNETCFNPMYAIQSDHIQSERKPPAGYGLDNMEPGVYVYDNPEVLKNDSDSTYQTIPDGQLDPSFDRSNGQPPAVPQKQYGKTAYDYSYI